MKKFIVRSLTFISASAILGVLTVLAVVGYFSMTLPKISSLADYNPAIPSQILSQDGTVLLELGRQDREVVEMDKIPDRIVQAFLAAEDDKFYSHDGVDMRGILRAFVANIKAGRIVQGGSTITQQVAKSLLLTRERSISRKIKDFLLALRIEEKFSKDEILYLYLNQVYLGGGYYGVKAAFEGYFGKSLKEATVAEAAMMAGLLVAPGRYSPYVNPKFAKRRQSYVLRRLYKTDKISEKEYNEALTEKMKFQINQSEGMKAGYFTDWVRQRVIDKVGKEEFLTGGYRVETTLDWELQKVAEKEVLQGAKSIDKRQGFAGPLKTLEDEEGKIRDWLVDQRKRLLKDNSKFFTLGEENNRKYELEYDKKWWEKKVKRQNKWAKIVRDERFLPGNGKEDQLIDILRPQKMYKAVVLGVNNYQRLIYVSIGGTRGIIPYRYFRWAHERKITADKNYWSWQKRPENILSRGDVVWVQVRDKDTKLLPQIHDSYRKSMEGAFRAEKMKKLKEDEYLLCFLDQKPTAQGALVSMKPKSGEIVSFVGGRNFDESQFNRAIQSQRQPGSSFKPILYAAALENGYTPASIIMDSPEALAGVDASLNWKPRNYDQKFKGPITFRNALEQSRNVPTIKIADDLGVETIHNFADRIGFDAKLAPDLSLALGSFGVTLLEIVSTFGIFPNGGERMTPQSIVKVVDREGHKISMKKREKVMKSKEKKSEEEKSEELAQEKKEEEKEKKGNEEKEDEEEEVNRFHKNLGEQQVYDERLSYIMTNLLRGVVLHGTGRGVKSVSKFLGGKTGTTNNYVDAWFLGFSSNLVTGVWTGFDDNRTLGWGETGAKAALPIWRDFMRAGLRKYGESDFSPPSGIINVMIDKETGEPVRGGNPSAFMEAFVEGTEPGSQEQMAEEEGQESEQQSGLFEEDAYYNSQ